MIRVMSGAGLRAAFAALLITAVAPACARAAGGVPEDDKESSRLTVVADFNHDGIADIAEALPEDGSGRGVLKVSLGGAAGGFTQESASPVLGRTPRAIVAGDFNGDGNPDVIVGDDDGTLTLFLGDGTGKLVRAGDFAHLDSVTSIAVADFDRDGIADIAVSDWKAGAVTVFLGTRNGAFRQGWSFRLRMSRIVARVSAADFNGDGNPDLAVVYGDDDQYEFDVMLGDGKGSFVHSPELSFARDPNSHCPA